MIKRVTIKDIARLAGVNISTVSRTLNPETSSRISAEKRERYSRFATVTTTAPELQQEPVSRAEVSASD